jgi:hypothetical protein
VITPLSVLAVYQKKREKVKKENVKFQRKGKGEGNRSGLYQGPLCAVIGCSSACDTPVLCDRFSSVCRKKYSQKQKEVTKEEKKQENKKEKDIVSFARHGCHGFFTTRTAPPLFSFFFSRHDAELPFHNHATSLPLAPLLLHSFPAAIVTCLAL